MAEIFQGPAMLELAGLNRPFAYACDFDPMPFEIDFTGYMSNTVVVRWMETLRVRMVKMHFSEINTSERQHLSVIARTEIDYASAVRYGDIISGIAWIEDVARARWRVRFDFYNTSSGDLAIRARQDGTFLSPDSYRPIRVPELIRGKFLSLTTSLA